MTKQAEPVMARAIRVLKFIGKLDDKCSRPLIIKYRTDIRFQILKEQFNNNKRGEQSLELAQGCIVKEGSDLNIEIHKQPQRRKIITLGRAPEGDLLCEAKIKFDVLWKHLVLESQKETKSNFAVEFINPVSGFQFFIVAEAHGSDLRALDAQIRSTIEQLKNFQPILSRLRLASTGYGTFIELGKTINGIIAATGKVHPIAQSAVACIEVVYKNFEAQEESHKEMQSFAESMTHLADQLDKLKDVPNSEEMYRTISQFPVMMEEVVDFIHKWLESWLAKYILAVPQKERVIELRKKVDGFRDRLVVDLAIEIRVAQELDDLVRALGGNGLPLSDPCMEGTRLDILQQIETEIKKTDGHNVIWIRGSPGAGKSALAASITTRLQDQNRHVIWFRFDRTQSTTITTEALWRVVACSFVRRYPSLRQHLAQGNAKLSSSNIDSLFETLIQQPLSTLDGISHEELPVIVIDALDECGGLRHDPSGRKDYDALLRTLRRWVEVDHLKKFKLVITSRPESRITQTFPDSTSIYVNIPSGSDVKPEDSASDDIRTYLRSRLDTMGVEPAWIAKALDYLVPRAVGVFIWATTVAEFLQDSPRVRFDILEKRKRGDDTEGLDDLDSLYLTVITTSFGRATKPEIKAITSVIGATIFAKQPLDDTALMSLPGVETIDMLNYIRNGLISVIDPGSILHFHHRSFEDFLLSSSFRGALPNLSDVQDRNLHERQLASMCLNCMVSSELHFNMCNLESSDIENIEIPASDKSAISPLVLYSSTFWVDHLVHTPCEETSMEAFKFVMYEKLLFWIEVMSILGKAHEVSAILKRALEWHALATLDPKNELTLFIRDALRFISAFIIPISESAPQIYLSALPFAPEHSLVGEKFRPRFPNTLTISDGRPSQWPMIVFVAEHHEYPVKCIVLSPDEKIFASISDSFTMYVCDFETGHCISGPLELRNLDSRFWGDEIDACFGPDGRHILVRCRCYKTLSCRAVIWDIERKEEVFQVQGFDFVFIHRGQNEGRIASMHWIDEDGSSIRTVASEKQHPTHILVKLWDIGNDIFDRLFEITGIAVAQFSPNGKYLAVERQSESVVELWSLEDGKVIHRFSHPSGDVSSLCFSPTSDCLMAEFKQISRNRLWRLDTQEMVFCDIYLRDIRPAIIHSSHTNRVFVPQGRTVAIFEVSTTSSKMIFRIEPLTTSSITSVCPSRDGHRLLMGNNDGTVRMWNLEDFGSNQPVTRDDIDKRGIAAFSPSGKMVATYHREFSCIELWDTATWKVVGARDIKPGFQVAFSADEKWIAVLSESLVTRCDINHPEYRFSFDPWSKRRSVRGSKVAFQTHNDLVICAKLRDNSDEMSGLLQVWKVKDHSECIFSLDINIDKYSDILLAPDGLTVILTSPISIYAWNHDTAQFHPFHFADEVHLGGYDHVYSPDGKFFACFSGKDKNVRVWDTQSGQLCGKPIAMSGVDTIALSPALNDRSLGDRLIALHCDSVTLLDIHTGLLYAQFWVPGPVKCMAFIRDGTSLMTYDSQDPIRIYDIAEHRNAIHGYESVLRGTKDGWMVSQEDELLFWVPLEHRRVLCLPHVETIWWRPTKVDLSNFKFGTKWTECIDQEWLKGLEERGNGLGSCLSSSSKHMVAYP